MISVILLTHNRLNLLKRCLRSILDSSVQHDFEIIVVNNGSTDGTQEYLNEINDKRIRTIPLDQNLGVAAGRNIGLKAKSVGSHFIFLDDDCMLEKGCLNFLYDAMLKTGADIVTPRIRESSMQTDIMGANIITGQDELGDFVYFSFQKNLNRRCFVTGIPGSIALHRNSILKHVGFFDERYFVGFEDLDYSLRVNLIKKRIIFEPRAIVIHDHPFSREANPYNSTRYNTQKALNGFHHFRRKWGLNGAPSSQLLWIHEKRWLVI